jgi:hypothetical protein
MDRYLLDTNVVSELGKGVFIKNGYEGCIDNRF